MEICTLKNVFLKGLNISDKKKKGNPMCQFIV